MRFRTLTGEMLVAGQIFPADMAEAKALGVATIVNNRPDGEEPGQPGSAEIEAAARAAGLDYRHIPVFGRFGAGDVAAMAAALDKGRTLAFCTTGTRSTFLWAMAARARGMDGDSIVRAAAAAGYDLEPIRGLLA